MTYDLHVWHHSGRTFLERRTERAFNNGICESLKLVSGVRLPKSDNKGEIGRGVVIQMTIYKI